MSECHARWREGHRIRLQLSEKGSPLHELSSTSGKECNCGAELQAGAADADAFTEEVGALLDGQGKAAPNQVAYGEVIRLR